MEDRVALEQVRDWHRGREHDYKGLRPNSLSKKHDKMADAIDAHHATLAAMAKRLKTRQQAANVAWRVLKDWIEAQLAIVEAEMADVMEVFLPYAQRLDGATVYQAIQASGMKQLTQEGEE